MKPNRRPSFRTLFLSIATLIVVATGTFAFPDNRLFQFLDAKLGTNLLVSGTKATVAAPPTDLYFSEYIEGSSFNKAIEIYNGTGSTINMDAAGYILQLYSNGSATPSVTLTSSGIIIPPGGVGVLTHPSANAAILAQADYTSAALINFTGDDTFVLRKGGASGPIVDVIGQIGFDPGTEWGTGVTSTSDNTLVRKTTVCAGDTDGSNAFDPSGEWDGFATDTVSNLGSHTATCTAPVIAVTGGPLNYGNQAVNLTSTSQSITVTNNGNADLVLGTPTFTTGTQFSFVSDPNGTVVPLGGGQTTIDFTFTPTSTGAKADTVTINSNAGGPAPTVSLTGTGLPGISGTVNVGAGQTYTNLTNNDGLFQALNNDLILTGDLTVNITSDLTSESGSNSLRNLTEQGAGAGTYRVLIKPSGGPRTISGSLAGELIKLNGADRVTIDGWTGSAIGVVPDPAIVTRDLTITNTSTNPFASMVFFYNGLSNPSQNNTIQNVNIVGNSTSYAGIAVGGNGGGLGGDNDNNKVLNNVIKSTRYGIYVQGQSEANPDIGTQIVDNVLNSTGADSIRQIGIVAVNQENMQIRRNQIYVNRGGLAGGAVGIGLGADVDSKFAYNAATSGGIINCIVAQNKIIGVVGSNAYGAHGIAIAGAPTGQNRISNNMISGVTGAPTSPDLTTGVFIAGVPGSNTYLNYNSVAMTGDRGSGAAMPSYALAMAGTDPTVQLKNNIFYTSQVATGGAGVSYAIGTASNTFANLDSNFNAFYHSGSFGYRVGGLLSGTQIAGLSTWQSTVSDDANSQEVDPLFVSPTADLHLQSTSPVIDDATDVGTVADIDGDVRPAGAGFDIGADEVVNTPPIAVDDDFSTPQDEELVLTEAQLTGNDVDPDPQTLTITAVSNPTNGTVGLAGGTITFTPTAGFAGTAGFDYTVSDGEANDTGHVTVMVTPPDTTPPDTSITIGPSGTVTSSTAAFAFTSTEPGSTFECSMDGASFMPCSTGVEYVLTNGNHYFQVRATDAASNTDGSPASRTFTVRAGSGAVTFIVDRLDDSASADECIADMPNDCSLRRAIGTSQNGDTITFASDIYTQPGLAPEGSPPGVIELAGSDIDINTNITITGPGASLLTIDANSASRIFNVSELSATSISGVTLTGGLEVNGGAIWNAGSVTITNSTISNNGAMNRGGGVYLFGVGAVTVVDSTVSGNTAGVSGGGIHGSFDDGFTKVNVSGSTFADNCAGTRTGGVCTPTGAGGGIYFYGAGDPLSFSITNSTFYNNFASPGGGLHYSNASVGAVVSTTFSNSSVHSEDNGLGSQLTLRNSILSGCTLTNVGGIVNGGFNIDTGTTCQFGSANNSQSSTDPLLGPLQNNGGPTHTMALLPGSPAIDAGSAFALTTDQRGSPRPVDRPGISNAGDGSDIGAYELQAPTAASVWISGRVIDSYGRGIRGATVVVQGMDGMPKTAYSNTLGYYRIDGLPVGESFAVTVSARRYAFAAPTRFVNLADSIDDLNFTASP